MPRLSAPYLRKEISRGGIMGKYDPLREHLASQGAHVDEVAMDFAEIERLVGKLPTSAHAQREWWETTNAAKVQAHAWLSVGWQVQPVDLDAEQITFYRDKTVTGSGNTLASPPPVAARVDRSLVNEGASTSSAKSTTEHGKSSNSASYRSLLGDLAIALGAATAAGVTAGVSGIIGITHLPWWALALLTAAAGAVGFTVGQAIMSREPVGYRAVVGHKHVGDIADVHRRVYLPQVLRPTNPSRTNVSVRSQWRRK